MKKKIEIFGKKVPIIAILMVVLVIGTASAALFNNYATLIGTEEVKPQVYVTDSDGTQIDPEEGGTLNFSSPATFTINNTGNSIVTVRLNDTLNATDEFGTDVNEDGLSVAYSGNGVNTTGDLVTVKVPAANGVVEGMSIVTVTLVQAPNVIPGNCTIEVDVDPY